MSNAMDIDAITTAMGAICFAVARRLPEEERRLFLCDLVALAHARNTANDLHAEALILDLARSVAVSLDDAAEKPPSD